MKVGRYWRVSPASYQSLPLSAACNGVYGKMPKPAVFARLGDSASPVLVEARMIIASLMKVLWNRVVDASESRQYSGRLGKLWIPRDSRTLYLA